MKFSELYNNPFDPPIQKSSRVLMVINEPESLTHHSELLQTLGYEVLACDSYGDGLEMLQNDAFDFVTVGRGSMAFEGKDGVMPSTAIDRGIPVLVMARRSDMDDYLETLKLEAVDDSELPVPHEEFMRILRTRLLYSVGRQPDA